MVTRLEPAPTASSSTLFLTRFLTKKGTLARACSASFVHSMILPSARFLKRGWIGLLIISGIWFDLSQGAARKYSNGGEKIQDIMYARLVWEGCAKNKKALTLPDTLPDRQCEGLWNEACFPQSIGYSFSPARNPSLMASMAFRASLASPMTWTSGTMARICASRAF